MDKNFRSRQHDIAVARQGAGHLRRLGLGLGAAALVALAGCVEQQSSAAAVERPAPLPVPPEFLPCSTIPEALAQADALVRDLGAYGTSKEAAYWVKRQERLIARAYECRG